MTKKELSRTFGVCRPFMVCKTKEDFGFSHKNGICHWDKPNYCYNFFRIIFAEDIAYHKRKKNGSVIGKKVICLN